METWSAHKIELVMQLRRQGIRSDAVMQAMEHVSRADFLPPHFADQAYTDTAIPIACGQTTSQPLVIARCLDALEITPQHKVLEVGLGSGYQTALLSRLARRVYSLDIHEPLVRTASAILQEKNCHNVTTMVGDGCLGWPHQAPFQRIVVCAAASRPPRALLWQLDDDGRMIIPLDDGGRQRLGLFIRRNDAITLDYLDDVQFVPLIHAEKGVPA